MKIVEAVKEDKDYIKKYARLKISILSQMGLYISSSERVAIEKAESTSAIDRAARGIIFKQEIEDDRKSTYSLASGGAMNNRFSKL